MFDGVALEHHHNDPHPVQPHPFYSPIPQHTFRPDSPAATNGAVTLAALDPSIRINELEVINTIINDRMTELEVVVESARIKEAEMKRRIEELEQELLEYREGPRQKKMRYSDIVDEDKASTPGAVI